MNLLNRIIFLDSGKSFKVVSTNYYPQCEELGVYCGYHVIEDNYGNPYTIFDDGEIQDDYGVRVGKL